MHATLGRDDRLAGHSLAWPCALRDREKPSLRPSPDQADIHMLDLAICCTYTTEPIRLTAMQVRLSRLSRLFVAVVIMVIGEDSCMMTNIKYVSDQSGGGFGLRFHTM